MNYKKFISSLSKIGIQLSPEDTQQIARAYEFGSKAHAGQLRANGDGYFTGHCIPVALHIAELGMGPDLICAALLHDTIEDTEVTATDIEQEFGSEISLLVEGVSKLGKIKYQGNERHVESLRKFFITIAMDVRVVILKLADRWHNLETLEHLPKEKQQRIAQESILIYAPLASRLGMGKLVTIINDLAFPYAYPAEYQQTKAIITTNLKKANETNDKIYRVMQAKLYNQLGYSPEINKRVKGLYSLYRKLQRKNWVIEEIFDLVAIRIVVRSVPDCYQTLGIIHGHWRPVPGRVKDYIAVPKPNGYQSLHTAIFSGDGSIVEAQIRTAEMHELNEVGIASHHSYKNASSQTAAGQESFAWIGQLREFQDSEVSPDLYLKRLRTDFFQDRIFVFTPTGDVIDLPIGASLLDFAFAVHSEVGMHAQGGKINGKYCALKSKLSSGDIAEITTNSKAHPSDKWIEFCVTSGAIGRIRKYLKISVKDLH